MILDLEVSKVRLEAFEKDGKKFEAFSLVCVDKGDGRRLSHAIEFNPDQSQRETLKGLSLRDRRITVDVEKVGVSPQGAVLFRGHVMDLDKLANGKLAVEKGQPAKA